LFLTLNVQFSKNNRCCYFVCRANGDLNNIAQLTRPLQPLLYMEFICNFKHLYIITVRTNNNAQIATESQRSIHPASASLARFSILHTPRMLL